MRDNYSIDKVKAEEIETLLECILALAAYQGHPNAVEVTIEQLSKDLEESWYEAYFLKKDGNVIGSCIIYNKYSSWKGRAMHLDELYIIPEERRMGWGRIFFDFILDLAGKKQCTYLSWSIAPDNAPAIQFYESYGAQIRQYWLDASLPTA